MKQNLMELALKIRLCKNGMGHLVMVQISGLPLGAFGARPTNEHLQHAHQVTVTHETPILRNTDIQEASHTLLFPLKSSQVLSSLEVSGHF